MSEEEPGPRKGRPLVQFRSSSIERDLKRVAAQGLSLGRVAKKVVASWFSLMRISQDPFLDPETRDRKIASELRRHITEIASGRDEFP